MPQPLAGVEQVSSIFFGSGYDAPVNLEVEVMNRGNEPLRVREIEVTSPGMTQYTLYPLRRYFNDTIAPGATKIFSLAATAYTNIGRLQPTEPLSLRMIIEFEAGESRFREVYFMRNISY